MAQVRLNIAPRIIQNISSIYTDANRVIMELVDNSIDDVESPGFYDTSGLIKTNKYPRKIEIEVKIHGTSAKDGQIIVTDNCNGIPELSLIVQNIGNSNKRSSAFTNGQFGFGIFSFLAICKKLEIITKHSSRHIAQSVIITSDKFEQDNINDVKFDVVETEQAFPYSTGTQVILSEFSYHTWKQIKTNDLKAEIEKHFDLILSRENIRVSVIDIKGYKHTCSPFSYKDFKDTLYEIEHTVSYNKYLKGKKLPTSYDPIQVKIVYTPGKALSRPPVFISKGRRIAEVREIKSFSSDHKRDLWSHPNVTGFINLRQLLNPTIARTDYKNEETSRRIFGYIKNRLEPLLLQFIEDNTKKYSKNSFTELENKLNEALNKIPDMSKRGSANLNKGDKVELDDTGNEIYEVLAPGNKFKPSNPGKRSGRKITYNKPMQSPIIPPDNNSLLKITIDTESEPILDNEGNPKRSELFGIEVIIYRKHSDFDERIDNNTTGEKISYSLITYIIGEMLIHYTDKYFSENETNSKNSKDKYIFLTSRLYRLEKELKSLVGKPIS